MKDLKRNAGFWYLPAVGQYSAGVRAADGHSLVRFSMGTGSVWDHAAQLIERARRSFGIDSTLGAVELRSPRPMDEGEFGSLNASYREQLRTIGALDGITNPVARTNVCPVSGAIDQVCLEAFTLAVPDPRPRRVTFVVSGSAEAPEGVGSYRDNTVAVGDVSPSGLVTKATWVLDEMERRLAGLSVDWTDCAVISVYTTHRSPQLEALVGQRTGNLGAVGWHLAAPPVEGLEFEMDCRSTVPAPDDWMTRPDGGPAGGSA